MPKSGKRVLRFYNNTGSLDNIIQFLENLQKKVNFINLNVTVEGKSVKITIFGPKDLQYLACDNIRDLVNQYLS